MKLGIGGRGGKDSVVALPNPLSEVELMDTIVGFGGRDVSEVELVASDVEFMDTIVGLGGSDA